MDFFEDCIDKDPSVCTEKQKSNEHYVRYFLQSEKRECLDYEQMAESMNDVLRFCVDMENSSWYGGAENTYQRWPINKLNWTDNSYVTKEQDSQSVSKRIFRFSIICIRRCLSSNITERKTIVFKCSNVTKPKENENFITGKCLALYNHNSIGYKFTT